MLKKISLNWLHKAIMSNLLIYYKFFILAIIYSGKIGSLPLESIQTYKFSQVLTKPLKSPIQKTSTISKSSKAYNTQNNLVKPSNLFLHLKQNQNYYKFKLIPHLNVPSSIDEIDNKYLKQSLLNSELYLYYKNATTIIIHQDSINIIYTY